MKIATKLTIAGSVIVGIIIAALVINTFFQTCDNKFDIVESGSCYEQSCYENDILGNDQTCNVVNATTNEPIINATYPSIVDLDSGYESVGALETKTGIFFVSGLIIIGLLVFIGVITYRIYSKKTSEEVREIKVTTSDEIEVSITKYFARKSNVPFSEDDKGHILIKKDFIKFYKKSQPFLKSDKEWRIIKQFEITEGELTGIYTSILPLGRDPKKWIETGDFFWENTLVDRMRINEIKYPIYQPRTQKEKIYEQIEKSGRVDLLEELRESEIQQHIRNPTQPQQPQQPQLTPEQQLTQQQNVQPLPPKKQKWYRRRTTKR
jgi:hypothetical protein|tara:strand:- start:2015 stop:2980 length:966 start_codon:yes stop_codon:yes gene_type:complete